MPLPPEVAKGDDRLSGEVIALNKGIDDRRCDVPPDLKADINNVIFVHTLLVFLYYIIGSESLVE